ncbi:hypothetical protein ACS0PU_012129 [Formica fusca]
MVRPWKRREERSSEESCLRRPHGIRRRLTGRPVFSYGRHMMELLKEQDEMWHVREIKPSCSSLVERSNDKQILLSIVFGSY